MNSEIPLLKSPVNSLKSGPNSDNLAAQALADHPVQALQKAHSEGPDFDMNAVRQIYGSGLAMTLATERKLAMNAGRRIPGVFDQADSMAMYDAITGRDLTMNYHDVLGKKEDQPVTDCRMDTHDHLEAQFGL